MDLWGEGEVHKDFFCIFHVCLSHKILRNEVRKLNHYAYIGLLIYISNIYPILTAVISHEWHWQTDLILAVMGFIL